MTEEIIPTNGTSAEDVVYAKKVKEIYIDGVNVAGCVRLQDDKISCDLAGECKGWENCYYKQLQRLEQENKDFEILAKSLYKRIEELEKENEALAFRERLCKADYEASEQENKELKEKLNAFVEHSKIESNKVYYKMLDYKTALKEIREIAMGIMDDDIDEGSAYYDADQIINKINEVLNDSES